jgi:hypothetical protein
MRDFADIREVANDWNRRQRSLGRKARAATASLEEAFSERRPPLAHLTLSARAGRRLPGGGHLMFA